MLKILNRIKGRYRQLKRKINIYQNKFWCIKLEKKEVIYSKKNTTEALTIHLKGKC